MGSMGDYSRHDGMRMDPQSRQHMHELQKKYFGIDSIQRSIEGDLSQNDKLVKNTGNITTKKGEFVPQEVIEDILSKPRDMKSLSMQKIQEGDQCSGDFPAITKQTVSEDVAMAAKNSNNFSTLRGNNANQLP